MGQPVVHFEVVGKDPDKLRDFYGELFGWKFNDVPGGPTQYSTVSREDNSGDDGVGIGGGVGGGPEGYEGHVTFYVEVGDLEVTMGRIEGLGGSRLVGPMDVPDGPRIAMFADPEGHLVGLIEAGSRRS